MKIERFTDKAREAISEAAEIAKQHNHNQIEPEHLLDALLTQEAGIVEQIIQKVGGPFIENNRGGYTINQSFFAENFGQKRQVIHDCASGRYYQYLPKNGLYQELRVDTVRAAIKRRYLRRSP